MFQNKKNLEIAYLRQRFLLPPITGAVLEEGIVNGFLRWYTFFGKNQYHNALLTRALYIRASYNIIGHTYFEKAEEGTVTKRVVVSGNMLAGQCVLTKTLEAIQFGIQVNAPIEDLLMRGMEVRHTVSVFVIFRKILQTHLLIKNPRFGVRL